MSLKLLVLYSYYQKKEFIFVISWKIEVKFMIKPSFEPEKKTVKSEIHLKQTLQWRLP